MGNKTVRGREGRGGQGWLAARNGPHPPVHEALPGLRLGPVTADELVVEVGCAPMPPTYRANVGADPVLDGHGVVADCE